jgi:UDP-4-amino-4,6-dideoxy-L-N-acetyl-beta-L-altrosamine transaminase
MTVFSFHAIKTMTTGEGGCVTTNDEKLYHRLQKIRNSGIEREKLTQGTKSPWYYEVQELSGQYNMTEMQAALGLSQLKRLDAFIEKRKKLVKYYRQHLAETPNVRLFDAAYDDRTCNHLMCLQIDFEACKTTRTELVQALRDMGIGTQYHYIPLYRHPLVAKVTGDLTEQYPEMEAYYKQALSFPFYYDLEESDVKYICDTLKKLLSKK